MPGRANVSGPDIGRLMYSIGSSIKRGSIVTITHAAAEGKKYGEREIRKASGGDMKMSGVGRVRGRPGDARVGIRYDINPRGELPSATVKATGPLHLLERDTSPHYVTSAWGGGSRRRRAGDPGGASSVYKRGRKGVMGSTERATISVMSALGFSVGGGPTTGKGGRRAVLNMNSSGIGFRRYGTSKGTKGKHPFRNGYQRAQKPISRIMRTNTFRIIQKAAKP